MPFHFSEMQVDAVSCSATSVLSDSWSAAHQTPLSVGLSRQEYWSGLSCPPPGDLLDPEIEPVSPASPVLQVDSLPLTHWGSPVDDTGFSKPENSA